MDVEKKRLSRYLFSRRSLALLGMTSSSYEQALTPDLPSSPPRAITPTDRVIEGRRYVYPEMAAAGLWTTPTDLAKLAIEEQLSIQGKSNKVLSKDMARLMVTPRIKIGGGQNMALGFFLVKHDRYFGHGGQDAGFICQYDSRGRRRIRRGRHDQLGRAVRSLINAILAAIAREYGWTDYVPEPVEVMALSEDVLRPMEGRYKLDSDNVVSVKVKGAALTGAEPERRPSIFCPYPRPSSSGETAPSATFLRRPAS